MTPRVPCRLADPSRHRGDREARVGPDRPGHDRAVGDEQARVAEHLALGVDDAGAHVVAHGAAAERVGGQSGGPSGDSGGPSRPPRRLAKRSASSPPTRSRSVSRRGGPNPATGRRPAGACGPPLTSWPMVSIGSIADEAAADPRARAISRLIGPPRCPRNRAGQQRTSRPQVTGELAGLPRPAGQPAAGVLHPEPPPAGVVLRVCGDHGPVGGVQVTPRAVRGAAVAGQRQQIAVGGEAPSELWAQPRQAGRLASSSRVEPNVPPATTTTPAVTVRVHSPDASSVSGSSSSAPPSCSSRRRAPSPGRRGARRSGPGSRRGRGLDPRGLAAGEDPAGCASVAAPCMNRVR